jgi:hypothetical protein
MAIGVAGMPIAARDRHVTASSNQTFSTKVACFTRPTSVGPEVYQRSAHLLLGKPVLRDCTPNDADYMWVGRRLVPTLEALRSARSEQFRNLASQDAVESSSLAHSAEWLYLSARVQR